MSGFGRTLRNKLNATKERIPSASSIKDSVRRVGDSVVDKVSEALHKIEHEHSQGGMRNFRPPRFGFLSGNSGECIQMIRCAPATKAQLDSPNYIPQLELTEEAMDIISLRFVAPISIIVYVGDMGVGKSKLATVTINALHQTKPSHRLNAFQSGAAAKGVTHGVWMWSEPLPHPSGEGSVMLLDCEGMGDMNENLGANLYLFCMIISTSFALILRPPRIPRPQCDRLYHALLRFEQMKSNHVLPNLWLVPELTEYVLFDSKKGCEVPISKKEWLKLAFNFNEQDNSERVGTVEANDLQQRFKKINDMLPKKDVVKIARLPESLVDNSANLNVWSLLREPNAETYFQSIQDLLDQLLSTGGKLIPGAAGSKLYIGPCELAAFMKELIQIINSDKKPNPDSLVDKYLLVRFVDGIVKEKRAKFDKQILEYVEERCKNLAQKEQLETEDEMRELDKQMNDYRKNLTQKCLGEMIRAARFQLLGIDAEKIDKEFRTMEKQKEAAKQLPAIIQKELVYIEERINAFREPEDKINETRTNMKIKDTEAKIEAMRRAEEKARQEAEKAVKAFEQEQRINAALSPPNWRPWLVKTEPCQNCGSTHIDGVSHRVERGCVNQLNRDGTWYYFDTAKNEMVCDACRIIHICSPTSVCCAKCHTSLTVTQVL